MIRKTLLGAVTIGLLSFAPVSPATGQAATQQAQETDAATGVAYTAQRWAYISGVVRNQLGRPQDDVLVEVFRAGEIDTPLASQLTYASTYGDDQVDHGYYDIELGFDPTLGNEFVVRFSSLPDAPTQFRSTTYPRTLVATGKPAYLDLRDVRMKLSHRVDSTTAGAVHRLKRGKPARRLTVRLPARAKAVLPVTVVAGAPGILSVLGKARFTVTKGKRNRPMKFEVTKGKRVKKVRSLTRKLAPVRKTPGVSTTTFALPTLAGSTATTKKVCKQKRGKRTCTRKKTWSSSETYTLHVSYSGSDEAKSSQDSIELTVLAPKSKRQKTTARQRPNTW